MGRLSQVASDFLSHLLCSLALFWKTATGFKLSSGGEEGCHRQNTKISFLRFLFLPTDTSSAPLLKPLTTEMNLADVLQHSETGIPAVEGMPVSSS